MRRSMVWSLFGIIAVAIVSLGATILVGHTPILGLDLKGGVSVVLQPQGTVDDATLSQAVSIIQNRVNGLGVANSNIERQGHDVVVSLPGIKNSQNALKVLGTTATLYFRPVYCAIPAYTPPKAPTTASSTPPSPSPQGAGVPGGVHLGDRLAAAVRPARQTAPTTPATTPPAPTQPSAGGQAAPSAPVPLDAPPSQADCSASNAAQLPTTSADGDTSKATVIVTASPTSGYSNKARFILGPSDLTGKGVKTASVSQDQNTSQYVVNLSFNSAGSAAFDKMAAVRNQFYSKSATSADPRSQEAIELDGVLESAPTIEQSSFNGQAQISGSFTAKQASDLSLELRYGSLPVRFTPQSVQTVSATIGSDSLKAGLLAGLGGIVLVMLYMILYYRALGLVVLIGLGVGGALLYSIITELSQTSSLALTLSGVTGIIVSVGITVDSYVVYFERLKDEVRGGRSIRQSTERSFARAFRTVLTADFVSFLAALILYLFTAGDVRGFAFTLGLSTLLDVATAYLFIRPMVILVGRRRAFTDNPILGVARGLGVSAAGGTS
ncbi:MAG: protein translocase subunit SecD [Acidimicrobiales bacterium]